jgi:carboxylesterase
MAPEPAAVIDTEPFFLQAGQTGCLLLHGFTATPHDMRFIAGGLHRSEVSVCAVRLPGHATTPEDMAEHSWQHWYEGARDGLSQLRQSASRVVVVGQSMGALLALKLAAEHPEQVAGVALLSTALVASSRWMYRVAPVIPYLTPWLPARARFVTKGESDIADREARSSSPTYRRVAVRSIYELLQLQAVVRPLLPRVRQPALVVHSRQDHACSLENVAILESELGGSIHPVILDDSYHVISVDVDKERVAREILAFVQRLGADEIAPARAAQNG